MVYDFNKQVKLFMVFDILGDTKRSGPVLWKIDRERLEDIKDHVMDLILMVRLLRKYLPDYLDFDKINDYIICHDLPEAITGDITRFEGVSGDEITRVNNLAIDYISDVYKDVMDFRTIFDNYESRNDLESKVVNMLDRVHSATTFIKYQSEYNVDMDKEGILPALRNNSFVVEKIEEGKDIADMFFEFHMQYVFMSDEECKKYGISREDGNKIVSVISSFANEFYNQKLNRTLLDAKDGFPENAMIYNRNKI
jgi:5'-deoxynucleotidase YfbR-like HD superfamily hydrolase